MTAEFARDAAATAAVFGFFASAWFGWAQEEPPRAWRPALIAGAVAALGAVVLTRLRRSELVPAWVALVVGVHLFPLATLLQYPLIGVAAALVTVIAVVAVPLARSASVPVSAVTGGATGCALLAAAAFSLVSVV